MSQNIKCLSCSQTTPILNRIKCLILQRFRIVENLLKFIHRDPVPSFPVGFDLYNFCKRIHNNIFPFFRFVKDSLTVSQVHISGRIRDGRGLIFIFFPDIIDLSNKFFCVNLLDRFNGIEGWKNALRRFIVFS